MKIRQQLLSLSSVLAFMLLLGACSPQATDMPPTPSSTLSPTFTEAVVPTMEYTQTPWIITAVSEPTSTLQPDARGIFFLSLPDGGYKHIFAYSPGTLPLTRLTADGWDDITPALSPDGKWLAYASRRNGYWDLYLLDLFSGAILRQTDTLAYDASPSWSPDGSWLAYESYGQQSLDILIRSVGDSATQPIPLTMDSFMDCSPAWSPRGRQIAFVSNRSGEPEIWIVDLDHASSDYFVNLSQSPTSMESHPAWSPDGTYLAWASADPSTGLSTIFIWDARFPESPAVPMVPGDWPAWWNASQIITGLSSPNHNQLVGYDSGNGLLSLPPLLLPGELQGLGWGISAAPLPGAFVAAAGMIPQPLYQVIYQGHALPDRTSVVEIFNTQALYPQMSDAVDEAFEALRRRVAMETGWDALANLEYAFIPLGIPLDPGFLQDWLFTGRAFTLDPALYQAGWMVVVREDYHGQTWWRIFLRTTAQDGSQGRPLGRLPWDFSTRSASSRAYEQGGSMMTSPPAGYWLDLTSLAAEYGWERLPAITEWRTYYSGSHFNELAFTGGRDWYTAMLELYPQEALYTPTIVIPATRTPTRTPLYYRSPTSTRTPTSRPTESR